jgi:hypothetical protein
MAIMKSNWFFSLKVKLLPFLYKKCPAGNYHFFTDKLCFCRVNEYSVNWNGGILDMTTGLEQNLYNYKEL